MKKYINIDEPRHDQTTFVGRATHFFTVTNPMNVLASDEELEEAKRIVEAYRMKTIPVDLIDDEKLWQAKELYDSAFHPQTGEKLFLPGRISFQVPGNMFITGCMLTFYKSTPAVIFWQWANQSFNALVNYTNRNASVSISNEQLGMAYALACGASVLTALGFNKVVARTPRLSGGVIGRFVPLLAVAAANCINIPLMRQMEIKNGITIKTEEGEFVGQSTQAAKDAIAQVIPSRIAMAIPGMTIPPLIMAKLERTTTYIKNPWLRAPTTVLMTGIALTFSTPLACALFPQNASIGIDELEPELRTTVKSRFPGHSKFFYNKGL